MEPIQQIPSMISKTYWKLHTKLLEIEAEVVQFAGLPSVNDHFAKHIEKRFAFLGKQLTAEKDSNGCSLPYDLLDIETRLLELEAEFYRVNLNPRYAVVMELENDDVVVDEDYDRCSLCESCLNDNIQSEIEPRRVFGVHETLHEVVVPQQRKVVFLESLTTSSDPEKVDGMLFECRCEKTGGGMRMRRPWWKWWVF